MNFGVELTSNPKKFNLLLDRLKSNLKPPNLYNFIFIKNNRELNNEISNLDILLCYEISNKIFNSRSNKLRWIHFGNSGIEKSLFPSIINSKVILSNSKGIHSKPVSEFVFGLILNDAKLFSDCNKFKQNKVWTQWDLAKQIIQLHGSTIGIIGYGNIGKEIARKAKVFGMNIIATRRLQKTISTNKYIKLIPTNMIDVLMEESDYIVVSCPLTPKTKKMINKDLLYQMKESAFIINISRGEILDKNLLIDLLKKNKIRGAALDVFNKEPLNKNSELFKLDNVFLSPHISGNFKTYQSDVVSLFADNLNRFESGKNLLNRICKKRLY